MKDELKVMGKGVSIALADIITLSCVCAALVYNSTS